MQFRKCVAKPHYLSIKPCSRLREGGWGIDKVVGKDPPVAVLHRFNLSLRVSYCNWNSGAYLPHRWHLNAVAVRASSRGEPSCAAAGDDKAGAGADAEAADFSDATPQLEVELKSERKPTELTVSCTPLMFRQTRSFVGSAGLNLAPIWVITPPAPEAEAAPGARDGAAA